MKAHTGGLAAVVCVFLLLVFKTTADPCLQSCDTETEFETSPCIEPIPAILLDYVQGKEQPNIVVEGSWSEFPTGSISLDGFFGDHVYLMNVAANTGFGNFSFFVPREGIYNISVSYAYFEQNPNVKNPNQDYNVFTDSTLAGTFFVNQRLRPPPGNLTLLGQFHIISSGYVFLNATVKVDTGTTVTASLDAVYVVPADPILETGAPPSCALLRTCLDFEFISAQPTLTTNRQCSVITNCTDVQFQLEAATDSTDRKCSNLTQCNKETQFEDIAATVTSDRVCKNVTVCPPSQYETQALTQTSNRLCEGIASDHH